MSFFSEELVKKYPSLKKFDEQGDNHVEVSTPEMTVA